MHEHPCQGALPCRGPSFSLPLFLLLLHVLLATFPLAFADCSEPRRTIQPPVVCSLRGRPHCAGPRAVKGPRTLRSPLATPVAARCPCGLASACRPRRGPGCGLRTSADHRRSLASWPAARTNNAREHGTGPRQALCRHCAHRRCACNRVALREHYPSILTAFSWQHCASVRPALRKHCARITPASRVHALSKHPAFRKAYRKHRTSIEQALRKQTKHCASLARAGNKP